MINLRNKKIIVTFLMHLGDLILITPFLQVLRRHAQGSEITLVVDEKVADVVRYNPNIDHLVTVDKKGKDNSVRALWRIGRHLHQHHYDILINLHPNERTSFLAAVIHAKQFVGMSHFLVRPLMDRYTRLDRIHLHAADMYINVLAQLGIDDYRNYYILDGEGRFVASPELVERLATAGQIATQYVDENGEPGMGLDVNPNGSVLAVEGITSPDGRVLGKMGHTERSGEGLYKNVPGNKYQPLIEGGVSYFTD